jgi:hypothetical protein
MAESFSATVDRWAGSSKERMTAVFRQSAQALSNEVRRTKAEGGNMPVELGNLRRSLMASTSMMPSVSAGTETFPANGSELRTAIMGATLGQTIYLGFQAEYARRQEYGFTGEDSLGRFYDQPGHGFVRLAAQRWQEIVKEQARIVRRRTAARAAFSRLPEQ